MFGNTLITMKTYGKYVKYGKAQQEKLIILD